MNQVTYRHRPLPLWQSQLLAGMVIALSGQLYLSPLASANFRLSPAVILFPIFLLALLQDERTLETGLTTTGVVVVFRTLLSTFTGTAFSTALLSAIPGGLYYLCYAALLCLFPPHGKRNLSLVLPMLWLCDFLANLMELALSIAFGLAPLPTNAQMITLAGIAALRAIAAVLFLWWLGYCRKLLIQEEHEERYQRLFLMTAQLKSELYLLENSTEQIEVIMSSAYQLYEALEREENLPSHLSSLALSITRDIHEVKKDSLRVLRGLESGLDEMYDRETLLFSDLLHILVETSYHLTTRERVTLTHKIDHNFSTSEHYKLASILRNLINNAMEAILTTENLGRIHVTQRSVGTNFHFHVSDNGPGMGERALQNIFQMGYSTKFNPVTGDMNRGVGLCTVKNLVEHMGGSISVQSKLGEGTTFSIIIPRKSLEEK